MDEAAVRDVVGRLNWIDWIVVLVVLVAAVGGVRDGLGASTLELAGSVLAALVATFALPRAVAAIGDRVPLPREQASVLAFLALLLLARTAFTIVAMSRRPRGPGQRGGATAVLSALAGLVPGAAHGLLIATLAVVPFVAAPVLPEASQAIRLSSLASRLVDVLVDRAPAGTLALRRRGSS